MPENTKPPLSRRAQARVFKIVNVPMRFILGLPVATPLGRNLMLAFIIGRKSGRTHRQPVSYVPDGDSLLTPGGGKWKLNLAAGVPVRIRLRGKDISATPELVSDVGKRLQTHGRRQPGGGQVRRHPARPGRQLRPGRRGACRALRIPDRALAPGPASRTQPSTQLRRRSSKPPMSTPPATSAATAPASRSSQSASASALCSPRRATPRRTATDAAENW